MKAINLALLSTFLPLLIISGCLNFDDGRSGFYPCDVNYKCLAGYKCINSSYFANGECAPLCESDKDCPKKSTCLAKVCQHNTDTLDSNTDSNTDIAGSNCSIDAQCGTGYCNDKKECVILNKGEGFVTDAAGHKYKTVQIGTQTWMAENYRLATNNAYRHVNNLDYYDFTYGLLYNFDTASAADFCPDGWHLPLKRDWLVLENEICNRTCSDSFDKLAATSWGGSDIYGFSALPAGSCEANGTYSVFGQFTYFWSYSPDENNEGAAYCYKINTAGAEITSCDKNLMISVRCLK